MRKALRHPGGVLIGHVERGARGHRAPVGVVVVVEGEQQAPGARREHLDKPEQTIDVAPVHRLRVHAPGVHQRHPPDVGDGMPETPRLRGKPRPLPGVAVTHEVDVHVPDAGGIDAFPGRSNDLVPGEALRQPAVEARIAQPVVEERRCLRPPLPAAQRGERRRACPREDRATAQHPSRSGVARFMRRGSCGTG